MGAAEPLAVVEAFNVIEACASALDAPDDWCTDEEKDNPARHFGRFGVRTGYSTETVSRARFRAKSLPRALTAARSVRHSVQVDTISYTDARAKLAATMDRVISYHAPVIITRHGSQACVLVSLQDWESMEETNYLRSSPTNVQRLTESIRELESGGQGIVIRDTGEFLRS